MNIGNQKEVKQIIKKAMRNREERSKNKNSNMFHRFIRDKRMITYCAFSVLFNMCVCVNILKELNTSSKSVRK